MVGRSVDPVNPWAPDVQAVDPSPIWTAEPMSTNGAARILVIDDDLLVAEALVFTLVQRGIPARFVVPATMRHLRDAVASFPELALLDVDRVDADPIEMVAFLDEFGVRAVVMGRTSQRELLGRCLEKGAAATVESTTPLEELVRRLTGLLSVRPQPPADAPSVRTGEGSRSNGYGPFAVLTPRERSVLAELMEGRTADQISKNAWVAVSTVRSQIKAILQKLGVNSQLAAVALARQAGWTGDDRIPRAAAAEGEREEPGPIGG